MRDSRFPETLTLYTPDPDNPGSFLSQTVPAILLERSRLDSEEPSTLHEQSEVLLQISSAVPPGSYLMRGTRRYDIGTVKVCRSLSGSIFGCRCGL